MNWQLRFTSRAIRDLTKASDSDRRVILAAVRAFSGGAIADVKKLRGRSEYRLRVGRWRILYELRGSDLIILRVRDRKDAY